MYHFLILSKYQKKNTSKYKICICCIFKDESKYLIEWIEYHKLVGFEHFYLYNNFSSDNYISVLQNYIDDGTVSLIDWPYHQGQMQAYKHWHDNFKNETQWVSFLDVDEFICPYYEINIYDWAKKYSRYPAVVMYWKMFGTSGLYNCDPHKLIIEQFTVSWDRFHYLGKVLYNTSYEIANFSTLMHHQTNCQLKFLFFYINIPPINEFKYFIPWGIHNFGFHTIEDFTIQVNHYWSKSYSDFLKKQKRSDVYYKDNPNTDIFFKNYENHNKTVDYKIYRFLIELKNQLSLRSCDLSIKK